MYIFQASIQTASLLYYWQRHFCSIPNQRHTTKWPEWFCHLWSYFLFYQPLAGMCPTCLLYTLVIRKLLTFLNLHFYGKNWKILKQEEIVASLRSFDEFLLQTNGSRLRKDKPVYLWILKESEIQGKTFNPNLLTTVPHVQGNGKQKYQINERIIPF